jgi:hypothetical protein
MSLCRLMTGLNRPLRWQQSWSNLTFLGGPNLPLPRGEKRSRKPRANVAIQHNERCPAVITPGCSIGPMTFESTPAILSPTCTAVFCVSWPAGGWSDCQPRLPLREFQNKTAGVEPKSSHEKKYQITSHVQRYTQAGEGHACTFPKILRARIEH